MWILYRKSDGFIKQLTYGRSPLGMKTEKRRERRKSMILAQEVLHRQQDALLSQFTLCSPDVMKNGASLLGSCLG